MSAIVIKTIHTIPQADFEIKPITEVEPFPEDKQYNDFIKHTSQLYLCEPIQFYQRIRTFLQSKQTIAEDIPSKQTPPTIQLTTEQQIIVDSLSPLISQNVYTPSLLHGVTGSGKTEVYVKLMQEAIRQNKSVIFLLPEVSLCSQFQTLLQSKMPNISIMSFHSASNTSQKKELWSRLLNKKPTIVIGVHLPVLLPIPNLGLIIVDEEHEVNYQEKKHPKINSKELAIIRASTYKIPILLGSATPSLNSLYNVKVRNWRFFQLKKRFSGQFPVIEKVPLTESKARKNFWITIPLKKAIEETIAKKEQVLIFLNRRGFSSFLLCKTCQYVFTCANCSVSLTLHEENQQEILKCHYCNHKQKTVKSCPECKNTKFIKKGIGTQQAVSILQKTFPSAVIMRADMDTTKQKRNWAETVKNYTNGNVDILVGTQTITKGYHFPKVTLVGVLWADMGLHFPMYNANETALQQLIQVAGRAGRAVSKSKVILQTINNHSIFKYLNESDYLKFYQDEINIRKTIGYPPFYRLWHIELKNKNPLTLDKDSDKLYAKLEKYEEFLSMGPVKPAVHKIQKIETRHIYIKTTKPSKTLTILQQAINMKLDSKITFVPGN